MGLSLTAQQPEVNLTRTAFRPLWRVAPLFSSDPSRFESNFSKEPAIGSDCAQVIP